MRTAVVGLILCLIPLSVHAAVPLDLGSCRDFCFLGKHLDILVDKEGKLTNVRPIIQVSVPPDQSQLYYLKVKTPMAHFRLELWSVEAFAQKESRNQYVYGIWLGCMIVSFFFNLFIFLSGRDLSYLYYILYLSGMTLSQMEISGHSHYLFPPWLSIKSLFLFGAFYGFWGIQFSKSFLHTHLYLPREHKFLNVLMGACCIPLILILAGMEIEGAKLLNFLGILAVFAGLYVGLRTLLKGYKPARFFLLAWSALLAGILVTMLGAFRILPWNFFTEYGIRIGSALEVVMIDNADTVYVGLTHAVLHDDRRLRSTFWSQVDKV